MLRISPKGGSEPVTSSAPLLVALRTGTLPWPSSGSTQRQSGASAATRSWSVAFQNSRRPARTPPACRLVRPAWMIRTSLANCSATLAWPTRSPSPAATISVIDTMPQAMPNIVSAVRSLCVDSVCSVSRSRSLNVMDLLQDDLVALLQRSGRDELGLHAVRDAELRGQLLLASLGGGVGRLQERLAVLVVDHRRLRHQQDVLLLLADDLGVGGHVRLQLAARVVDGDAHLERGHVVLLLAQRRDARDLARELAVLERLDRDAGLL